MLASLKIQWRVFLLYSIFIFALSASCTKKNASEDSSSCHFSAGLVEIGPDAEAEFKKQIATFNQYYAVYQKGEPGNRQSVNPYYQNPYNLSNDLNAEPNISIAQLSQPGDTCGLMIGFSKPYAEGNAIALYLILTNEKVTRINDDSCKMEYSYVLQNNAPVCFAYNTLSEQWSTLDKTVIDRWVTNLYGSDPAHSPAFRGYYIHHAYGKSPDLDDYLYVGLKKGSERDTLTLFTMNKRLQEIETKAPDGQIQKDVKFSYTRFHTSSAKLGLSETFSSPQTSGNTKNVIVRPCPPNCPQ